MLKERRKISIIGSVTTFAAGSPMGARAVWRSCNNDSILLPFSLGTLTHPASPKVALKSHFCAAPLISEMASIHKQP